MSCVLANVVSNVAAMMPSDTQVEEGHDDDDGDVYWR
jgi:hypothetical protein